MKQIYLIGFALLCMVNVAAQNGYNTLWAEYYVAKSKSLPRTAADIAYKIEQQAASQGDFATRLNAFLRRQEMLTDINPDSLSTSIGELAGWQAAERDSLRRSVLSQALIDMLLQHANGRRHELETISSTIYSEQDSAIDIYSPEELRKWDKRMYSDKVLQLAGEALAPQQKLAATSTDEYKDIIYIGLHSRYFAHDLLSLSSRYIIDKLTANTNIFTHDTVAKLREDIIRQQLRYYSKNGNRNALLLIHFDLLDLLREQNRMDANRYEQTLRSLLSDFKDAEVNPETALRLSQLLNEQNRNVEALGIIDSIVPVYRKYDRIDALRIIRDRILDRELYVSYSGELSVGEPLKVVVSHRNTDKVSLRLDRIDLPAAHSAFEYDNKYSVNRINSNTIKRHTIKGKSSNYTFTPAKDYLTHQDTVLITPPQAGIYRLIVNDDAYGSSYIHVSKLKLLTLTIDSGRVAVQTVDAKTGAPVGNVTIVNKNYEVYGEIDTTTVFTTDEQGRAEFESATRSNHLYPQIEGDKGAFYVEVYGNRYINDREKQQRVEVKLFTDRGIYRPGQQVYVKGIIYTRLGDSLNVKPNHVTTLRLSDANNKEIATTEVKSGEFGSFTYTFTLPTRTLSGQFHLRCDDVEYGGHILFRVEEYKRPTFEVLTDTLRGTPRLGDTLTVTGQVKTLTEIPLQGDTVRYSVVREPLNLFRYWFYEPSAELLTGTTTTDSAGRFRIPVLLDTIKNVSTNRWVQRAYIYRVSIEVTDQAGETQRTQSMIYAGTQSLVLSSDIPSMLNRDSVSAIKVQATNLMGIPVTVPITVTLYGSNNDIVQQGTVSDGVFSFDFKNAVSGRYRLHLAAKDIDGRLCETEEAFTAFSASDTKAPVDTVYWVQVMNDEFPVDAPATVLFATSAKDAYLFYDLFANGKRIESKVFCLSDTLACFSLPYKEEYGNGVSLTLCMVRDGKVYSREIQIRKPAPASKLKYKWNVIRRNLTAGQQEEWSLSLQNPDGTPARAELLATMYDAALDKIYAYTPSLNMSFPRYMSGYRWQHSRVSSGYASPRFVKTRRKYVREITLDGWVFPLFRSAGSLELMLEGQIAGTDRSNIFTRAVRSITQRKTEDFAGISAAAIDDVLVGSIGSSESANVAEVRDIVRPTIAGAGNDEASPTPQARTALQESAFFYPSLRTDAEGNVSIAFTLPESLTRWRFIGLAHSKTMRTATIDESITATKPFMLTPMLPRYLREGDNIVVAARLNNISGGNISGTVICELFDPITDKILHRDKQPFEIGDKRSSTFNFRIVPPSESDVVGIRLVADGGEFSDGEEHLLAILPSRTHLIESVPFFSRRNETKTVSLSSLFNGNSKTAESKSYTVELCVNPIIYAVQSLPLMRTPMAESAIDIAAAYYAAAVSSWLVNSVPAIRSSIETMRALPPIPESNLDRNSELQSLLLTETPYVAAADDERKHRAALTELLDDNTISYQLDDLLRQLSELQLSDGSFTWFKGMWGSRYITEQVVELLVHLNKLTGSTQQSDIVTNIIKNAYNYIYSNEAERYNLLTAKDRREYRTSSADLKYLYLCSLAPESPTGDAAKAQKLYLERLTKEITNFNIYGKAHALIALSKSGKHEEAALYWQSIREHSTETEEMGQMFYGVSAPIVQEQLIAAVIEAASIMGDSAVVENMQFSLLRLKQNRMWRNSVATANATYALLSNADHRSLTSGHAKLSIGSKSIEIGAKGATSTQMLGYLKTTLPASATRSKSAKLTNIGNTPIWGAVYGECSEDLSAVKQSALSQAQSIVKELFVRRAQGDGYVWELCTEKTQLRKGDQILTRLTLSTDRALDFVYIKDDRASCLEPIQQLSGYRNGYYISQKDASTQIFFDRLPKGSKVIEYTSSVSLSGTYTTGIARLENAYSTEFSAHSASSTIHVE